VLEDCKIINSDDLRLKEDKNIPLRLVNFIYSSIKDMRTNVNEESTTLLEKMESIQEDQLSIIKQIVGISEQFASLVQRLDAQLHSIQGTVLRGNTTIVGEMEEWLQSLQHKLISYLNASSCGTIESLGKEIEKWREEQAPKIHAADPAFKSYSETLMSQLQELFLAHRGHSDGNCDFTKMLLVKLESIQGDVSSIRDGVSSLTTSFSSFGEELRQQLKNSDNECVLAKLHEIENIASIIFKEQEEEKALLHAQTARLDVLIQNTHHVPTLMVLIPEVKKGLGKLNFFQDKARLVFFCSVTLEMVPCGKDGGGYEVDTLKPWVKKAIPVLRAGLLLLQLGLSVSGFPIPVAALANAAIDQAGRNQFLKCAADILQQNEAAMDAFGGELFDKGKDSIVDSTLACREAVRNLQLDVAKARTAYEAISSFLTKIDPTLKYLGLFKHVSKCGKVVWLKKNDSEVLKKLMDSDEVNTMPTSLC